MTDDKNDDEPKSQVVTRLNALPPILAGNETDLARARVERFYQTIADVHERWLARRSSPHTRRAYRQDTESLLRFPGIRWPDESIRLLEVTVADVQAWRDSLAAEGLAPKTLNRRVASVSSFYRYLQAAAAELRLPIVVPNPAHAQFIARDTSDPARETRSLSATRARQLMGLPEGESIVAHRDRALLKWYVYSGVRLNTARLLDVADLHVDGDETTVRIRENGGHVRVIGLHFAAAEAILEYVRVAGIVAGPLFRPRNGSRGDALADRRLSADAINRIVKGYLRQLPGATTNVVDEFGRVVEHCVYSTHSLRATTATLLLDAGVDIRKVQELLGHRHFTTTQIYDKRRRSTSESASHDVPV